VDEIFRSDNETTDSAKKDSPTLAIYTGLQNAIATGTFENARILLALSDAESATGVLPVYCQSATV
jgi:hypothetical protein